MKRYIALVLATLAGVLTVMFVDDRDTAGNLILGATAVFSWTFVVVYGWRSDWRATPSGRAIMVLVACIGAICTQGVATILSDYGYPFRDVIRPLLLLGVALAVLDLFMQLLRIQRAERAFLKED